MVKPRKQFVTGSSLVLGITPSDRDIVCLFKTEEDINEFVSEQGIDKELYDDADFISVKKNGINYLCTKSLEFFYRFKAYSGALDRLQFRDKDHRVELAKACLYYEPPKE